MVPRAGEGGVVRPLIVTAVLAEPVQAELNALRARYFPPERNHLDAHVTVFHALPGELEAEVVAELAAAVRREPPLAVVGSPRLLGRGVALRIDAPDVLGWRAAVVERWAGRLTAQDRGKKELHVTVQNKVTPEEARALHAALADRPEVHTRVEALALWHYDGGPWSPAGRFGYGA
jgi:GrpB-like predicted nucleotidyltransferase (UPF0157 family)